MKHIYIPEHLSEQVMGAAIAYLRYSCYITRNTDILYDVLRWDNTQLTPWEEEQLESYLAELENGMELR